jgi:probable F420-dependent oxidoreductase
MKVDSMLTASLRDVPGQIADLEARGYAGAFTAETSNDAMMPLALAAEHSTSIELGTAITVAFARNPMTVAGQAWALQAYSGGRLVLGLGSQIKPHITKRFSMPWSHPAARMREFVQAMRAIWACWLEGEPLQFRGEFYTHTLMTPFFSPPARELDGIGVPKVFLAGVGELMTETAGEVCDGFFSHPFTSERYLREVSVPALQRGREKAGTSMGDIEIATPVMVVTGSDEARTKQVADVARQQIAFYASTPAYRPVLELHGWGDLQGELNRMSKAGQWQEMGAAVDDELLATFAVVGEPSMIAGELRRRYGDVVSRFQLYPLGNADDPAWQQIVDDLNQGR